MGNFRPRLDGGIGKPTEERKSPAGRNALGRGWSDAGDQSSLASFTIVSDDRVEYQPRDRHRSRPLGLGLEDKLPDAQDGVALPGTVGAGGRDRDVVRGFHLSEQQWLLRRWAARSSTPRSCRCLNSASRDDNGADREGRAPEGWAEPAGQALPRDTDAVGPRSTQERPTVSRTTSTWTAGPSWCGVTEDDGRGGALTAGISWMTFSIRTTRPRRCARKAPIGRAEIEAKLTEKGLKSRIFTARGRNKPLSEREKTGQHDPFDLAARGVEHVFGAQSATWAGRWCAASADGTGEGADRAEEPRLQHAAPGATGTSAPRRQRDGRQGRSPPGVEDYREIGPPGMGKPGKPGRQTWPLSGRPHGTSGFTPSRVIFRGALKRFPLTACTA